MLYENFHKMLEAAIKEEVRFAIANIKEKAIADLEISLNLQADKLALSLLKEYDIRNMENKIVISVKK